MFVHSGVRILWLFLVCRYAAAVQRLAPGQPWDNDVYTGRHFDDYVTTPTTRDSRRVVYPAILAMYSPDCSRNLLTDLDRDELPPSNAMVFAKHDYVSSPKYIWYELDGRDDLKGRPRYKISNCLEYLFFANGTSVDIPSDRFHKGLGVRVGQWMWSKLRVTFFIFNGLPGGVSVSFTGRGPPSATQGLSPGVAGRVEAYVSQVMTVTDASGNVVHAQIVTGGCNNTHIKLRGGSAITNANTFVSKMMNQLQQQSDSAYSWRWRVAELYLHSFKQYVLLPKFTQTGVEIMTLPHPVFYYLQKFYREHLSERVREPFDMDPVVNDKEVKCDFVAINDEMVRYLIENLKPIAESWTKTTLTVSGVYGLREYHRGNILRMHVDRIQTHAIGIMINVEEDNTTIASWDLEVIDFSGKRRHIGLRPGEMLLYESASVIYGHPTPFRGSVAAYAFLHFRPSKSWDWTISEDGRTYVNHAIKEPINDFMSLRMLKSRHIRDEL